MKSRPIMMALLGLGLAGSPIFGEGHPFNQGNARGDQGREAVPGAVNYVEGAVALNGSQLKTRDIGMATVEPSQELSTGKGKAEMLLTPGVFLRLDDHSAVKMLSPDLSMTQVQLEKGRAGVEVDEIHDQNDLQVIDGGITTRLNKRGYYEFDANQPRVMVFKGEAHVELNDNKWKALKAHHEFALVQGSSLFREKPRSFDENSSKDALYNWSRLRSEYMAEANNQMAAEYGGPYFGPGWYWDPWAFGYAYMGFGPFASPFGWGFYPFQWGYPYSGFYGGHFGHAGWRRRDFSGLHRGYLGGAVRGNPGHAEDSFTGGGFSRAHR